MNRMKPTVALVGSALLLAACTGDSGDQADEPTEAREAVAAPSVSRVLAGGGATGLSVGASQSVWEASTAAITAAPERTWIREAADAGVSLGLPVLVLPKAGDSSAGPAEPGEAAESAGVGDPPATASASGSAPAQPTPAESGAASSPTSPAGPDTRVADELDRLGVTHVLHVGPDTPDLPGREVLDAAEQLPERTAPEPVDSVVATTIRGATTNGTIAARATLAAAGAEVLSLRDPDPRAHPKDVRAMAEAAPDVAIGLGAGFGGSGRFAQRVATAATGVELPGGGQTVFEGKRYVALYGHPMTGALGVLGEQGPKESVARVQQVAAQYEPLTDDTIVPAFEIIATVAAGGAGDDGNYSNEWDVEVLRPLVDAAAESGVYVVLDLQSGRSAFLPQAKLYEELLIEPHVGLALDPEWRLAKGERPLAQIGSVSAAEINQTMAWLADLTAERNLPQKMVLLHQFRTDMITDRSDLDLSHDELAVIVQMDGDGTLGQKLDTWGAVRADAPRGLRFGWKNFYDEDEPTPSPATTFQVSPTPWFVSYQ